jgi:Uma2 family endonuclease
VIHRDFKSGNVMLVPGRRPYAARPDAEADERLVVTDFGLAQAYGEPAAGLTRPGAVLGTLATVTPEQIAGDALGPATDVYALGVVLFVAGEPQCVLAEPLRGPTATLALRGTRERSEWVVAARIARLSRASRRRLARAAPVRSASPAHPDAGRSRPERMPASPEAADLSPEEFRSPRLHRHPLQRDSSALALKPSQSGIPSVRGRLRGSIPERPALVAEVRAMTHPTAIALDPEKEYELVDGQPLEKEMGGAEHGGTGTRLIVRLGGHVETHRLGGVYGPDTTFRIGRNERLPDAAFVSASRFPPDGEPQGIWQLAPDLAVEIVSPNDLYEKVLGKVYEYLEAGVRQVWVLSLEHRTVTVYDSPTKLTVLREADELCSEELLPGFRCHVGGLFRSPASQRPSAPPGPDMLASGAARPDGPFPARS